MQRQRHDKWVRARVKDLHLARVEELERATGLNQSQLMRVLIENAEVRESGLPVTVVEEKVEGGPKVSKATGTTL